MNNFLRKTLALALYRLFSLWDMIQVKTDDFIKIWDRLDKTTNYAFLKKAEVTKPEEQQNLRELLCEVAYLCHSLGLLESKYICNESLNWIKDPAYHAVTYPGQPGYKMPSTIPPRSFEAIYTELQTIRKKMYEELQSIRLAVIPANKAAFFEHDDLFQIKQSCSNELNAEVKAAGNCLAADLNTAAVFHLMRVAEYGLRGVARMIHVKIKHDIDLADWGELLKGIQKKVDFLELKKRTKSNEQKIQFYSGILSDMKGFKHIWRNRTMHARASYNFHEAFGAFERVRDFMQLLAKSVSLK